MSEYFLGSLGGLFNVFISIYHEWHVLERLTEWLYMERMGGRIQREGHQLGSFAKPPVDRILLTTTRHCPPIHLPSTLPTNFTQLKYTGMGCHFLLQGIFPTPGLNQCLRVSCIRSGFFTHWDIREAPLPSIRVQLQEKLIQLHFYLKGIPSSRPLPGAQMNQNSAILWALELVHGQSCDLIASDEMPSAIS